MYKYEQQPTVTVTESSPVKFNQQEQYYKQAVPVDTTPAP